MVAELLRYHQKFSHTPFQETQNNGKTSNHYDETGKCFGNNLLFVSLNKGNQKNLEAEKLGQQGQGKKTHQTRRVCLSRSASIRGTRFSCTNGRIFKITHYKYAKIYVDQVSSPFFVYLQKTETSKETLKRNDAFKLCAKERGVIIQNYQAEKRISKHASG